ncbi:MAG: hypothetical protein ACK55Z_28975, partial [bacterium]
FKFHFSLGTPGFTSSSFCNKRKIRSATKTTTKVIAAVIRILLGSLKLPQAMKATNPAAKTAIKNMESQEPLFLFAIFDLLARGG